MTTRMPSAIVSKSSTLAAVSAATLALAAAVATAQVPAGGGVGPGPGGGGVQVKVAGPAIGTGSGPVSLIVLATQPTVQSELKLTDAQKQKIAKIDEQVKEKREQIRNVMGPKRDPGGGPLMFNSDMAGAGMEEMKQANLALLAEADAAVRRELQRKQRTRLDQIALQADGPLAFERPDVLETLNLQAPQVELIQAILADGRGQMQQMGGPMMRVAGPGPSAGAGPGGGPGPGAQGAGGGGGAGVRSQYRGAAPSPEDLKKKVASKEFQDQLKAQFEKRRKETQGVREQMMQAIGRVLTRNQRASFNKMLGEPFDLKPFRTAAPNISVTTFDAPGAGAGDGGTAAAPKSDPGTSPSRGKAARPKRAQ